ncbi:excisionase family DNA-binding protein [Rhodococcus hoagii]|nr:excisionase family DNA-binding protein [Prescottella equi]
MQQQSHAGSASNGQEVVLADDAAEVLGIGATTVRLMTTSGRLKYVRVGRGRKISAQEIERSSARVRSSPTPSVDPPCCGDDRACRRENRAHFPPLSDGRSFNGWQRGNPVRPSRYRCGGTHDFNRCQVEQFEIGQRVENGGVAITVKRGEGRARHHRHAGDLPQSVQDASRRRRRTICGP